MTGLFPDYRSQRSNASNGHLLYHIAIINNLSKYDAKLSVGLNIVILVSRITPIKPNFGLINRSYFPVSSFGGITDVSTGKLVSPQDI